MNPMKRLASPPAVVRDVATLLARVGVGVVFVAHGLQKVDNGLSGTTAGFTKMGVPVPRLSALYATVVEVAGGAALVLGIGVPIVGLLLFLDMMGASLFAHLDKGLYVRDGGYELVLVLGLAALLLAAFGAGRFALDHLIAGRPAPDALAADAPARSGARR